MITYRPLKQVPFAVRFLFAASLPHSFRCIRLPQPIFPPIGSFSCAYISPPSLVHRHGSLTSESAAQTPYPASYLPHPAPNVGHSPAQPSSSLADHSTSPAWQSRTQPPGREPVSGGIWGRLRRGRWSGCRQIYQTCEPPQRFGRRARGWARGRGLKGIGGCGLLGRGRLGWSCSKGEGRLRFCRSQFWRCLWCRRQRRLWARIGTG